MRTLKILIFLLILNNFILLGFLFSQFTGRVILERVQVNITRVIDGDTFDSDIGKVRMLGINTPESKQPYYEQAKENLKRYEGKQVELEFKEKDKYQRILGYLFYNNHLVNEQQLSLGLASLYYYKKDDYYPRLKKAEENARKNSLGIWKHSINYGCISLINLKYEEEGERCTNREQLTLNNQCKSMSVTIKDDATHIYEQKIPSGIFSMNFSCIWNDDGDSLYIYDSEGLLLFYRYP